MGTIFFGEASPTYNGHENQKRERGAQTGLNRCGAGDAGDAGKLRLYSAGKRKASLRFL